jgi:uridine kinase
MIDIAKIHVNDIDYDVRPIVISVAGGSGSGKSYLCQHIKDILFPNCSIILSMDRYYSDLSHLDMEIRGQTNFDHPDSLDIKLFINDLKIAIQGGELKLPIYNFNTHTRESKKDLVPAQYRVILIDGIFALYWSTVRELADLKIYIDLRLDTCLARRIERDISERGRSTDSVKEQYRRTVLPNHHRFVKPTSKYANLRIFGDASITNSIGTISRFISNKILYI